MPVSVQIPEATLTMSKKRPPLTAAERRQLIHLSGEARDQHMDGRDHREHRRMDREREAEDERERRWMGKLTNRADVIAILDMYVKQNLVPLAERFDRTEAEVALVVERLDGLEAVPGRLDEAEAALGAVDERLRAVEVPWWRRLLAGWRVRFVRVDKGEEA